MVLTLLCITLIYIILINHNDKKNKLYNFKQKQRRDLCKYLSNNIIFYDKEGLKNFMIDQYYERAIFSGILIFNEEDIENIFNNITLNSNTITKIYNEQCL